MFGYRSFSLPPMSWLWVAVLSLSLIACSDGESPTDDDSGKQQVVAVGSQWYGHIPVWVGIERGIFERHGFAVRVARHRQEHGPAQRHLVRRGPVRQPGRDRHALRHGPGQHPFLLGRESGHRARFRGPGGPARDRRASQQLRGKRIGFPFGSSVDLTARMLLRQQRAGPGAGRPLVNLEVGDVPAVFRAGNVDAALIWEPGFSQLKAVEGATVLGMDTDTEVYRRFGTMTGPDVLVLGKAWVDADPARAKRFMGAYFESLDWVKPRIPRRRSELVAGRYIQQDLALIQANLDKFLWQDAADTSAGHERRGYLRPGRLHPGDPVRADGGACRVKPDFRDWVRLAMLPQRRPRLAHERQAELDLWRDPGVRRAWVCWSSSVLWELLVRLGVIDAFFLPAPSQVFERMQQLASGPEAVLWHDMRISATAGARRLRAQRPGRGALRSADGHEPRGARGAQSQSSPSSGPCRP